MSPRLGLALVGFLLGIPLASHPAAAAAASGPAEPPWTSLFDGKSLGGWVQKGGNARYEVRDGTILGTSAPNTKNSFLCTERSYGDFVLELEFKADPALNSGIQIRGQSSPEYQQGRVHGYQVEIDPDVKRGRNWTGGLYDEGRRGWLVDLKNNEAARKAFLPDQWNKFRIEARGDSIKTWLNGVLAADLVDSMDLEGFIGLQVHQVGKREEAFHVAWRNLRIQDLGRRSWLPVLDGKTLKGLHPAGEAKWAVEGGTVAGSIGAGARKAGLLFVDHPLDDFTARVQYRLTGGNGGLYLRSAAAETAAGARGLQVDLDAAGPSGGLYDSGGRGWVARATAPGKGSPPADAFHEVTVSAHGGRLVAHVDGARTAALNDEAGSSGLLAVELAAGRPARIEVRRMDLLSAALPTPVPGYPVGWCLRVQGTAPEDARAAGFEYIELAMQDVLDLSDEEFERTATRLAALGIPARSGYNIIPADLKLVGPELDKARQDKHLERALARAARLGLEMVVLNTGAAMKVPEGFSRDQAFRQLVEFGKRAATAAARHKIVLLVEPLRDSDTNIMNKFAETLALAKAVHRPNFKILVDYSFLTIQHEEPSVLLGGRGYIHHVWMANPNGRGYALSADQADYAGFFRALRQIGYRGGISVHARTDLFAADAPRGIAFLRQIAAQQLSPASPRAATR
jgi:sugar phosphate isomerase/epimerase